MCGGRTAPVDAFTGATPLSVATVTERLGDIQGVLTDAGYSAATLMLGDYLGSIGGTSTLLALVGAGFLIILGIASYRIIFGCLLGLLATAFFLNLVATENSMPYLSLNPLNHLMMGGAMFGFAYMATDPVSAAHMQGARWIFGFGIGVLTVLIRVFNPAYPEGVGLEDYYLSVMGDEKGVN